MCGIAGIITHGGSDPAIALKMAEAIVHRGPDDHGLWLDGSQGVGLAFRRLSIVDLSPHGHQPMTSADGRWIMIFNGEIYNHRTLRERLDREGASPPDGWRGHSDSETLLQTIAVRGLDAAIKQAAGMFALALWDRAERRMHLVRDRFGEKPLYYGWVGRDFVFASELKAIRALPHFNSLVDRQALANFLSRSWIAAPRSIWEGIYKLPAGCILSLDHAAAASPPSHPPVPGDGRRGLKVERFWSYREVLDEGNANPFGDEAEALGALEEVLGTVIGEQAVADVPVGAFLSGGIDSSIVVALYRKYSTGKIATYTIGFEEANFDESPFATKVAQHFATDHHTHIVTPREAREVIPLLPAIYDEPFADSSQIPTFLVSHFARRDVTVALSGDGGDELFGGYNRHVVAPALWRRLSRVPRPVRRVLAAPLGAIPAAWLQDAGELLPGARQPHFGAKTQRALQLAGSAREFDDIYTGFLDEWRGQGVPVADASVARAPGFDPRPDWSDAERTMYYDAMGYLPDDVLVKVDRAAMACSLETRAPFLDHRVAAIAARVPLAMKISHGRGKQILRTLLYREAPRALFERPKTGFAIPVGDWIRGPLRDWAEALLEPSAMRRQGYLEPAPIQARWRDHLSGRQDSSAALWAVLMFQAWRAEQA